VAASYGTIPAAPFFWRHFAPYIRGQYFFLFVVVLGSTIGLGAMRQRISLKYSGNSVWIFILFGLAIPASVLSGWCLAEDPYISVLPDRGANLPGLLENLFPELGACPIARGRWVAG
jgi:hypothetical protein